MFSSVKTRMKTVTGAVGVALLTVGVSAHAALPQAVTDTVTQVQTTASDTFGAVFPAIGTVVGLVVTIKLFKRFVNKI